MQHLFIEIVYLILIILALVMLAQKLRIAYPIVLVIGGLLLSFVDEFSRLTISPDLVFFIFLPPLLYDAAWQISWKEFWKWRRVIMGLAFPIVIITSCAIAVVSHALIPGFTLALGFLLGGIISPPDAVSATTIMRTVDVPKSMVSIIEGESLLNDASSLIVFRFALAAVLTGQFHFQEAAFSFVLVIVMGTLIGLAVAMIFYAIHRWLPVTPSIEIVLSLVAPYCMYYFAEHFHCSGVLAVVSGGLFLAVRRQQMLSFRSRLQGLNVWSNLAFVLNGIVFLLIGLQLPSITRQMEDVSLNTAIWYGLAISFALIIIRFLCTFGVTLFTRVASRFITVADPNPGWKAPVIAGWAGMRGVVSLAAALSIPLLANDGQPFPHRNLILFITFVVILVTLVLQGLTLPWLIRKIKPEDRYKTYSEEQQELLIQKKLSIACLDALREKYPQQTQSNPYLLNLQERMQLEYDYYETALKELEANREKEQVDFYNILLEMLEIKRDKLTLMNRKEEFSEELIRKHLSLIDMEEYKIRERMEGNSTGL